MSIHDTAPVRPGEELNLQALTEYLKSNLHSGAAGLHVEQFPSGHSNLTYMVQAGGQEYVLRRGPLGPVAPKAHDMAREFRILRAIHPHFQPAPEAILLCEDLSILGCVFFLMERRNGLVIRDSVPAGIHVSEPFIDCLAALHAVDISPPELAALGKPEGFLQRQVKGWSERWLRAQTGDIPDMGRIMEWLVRETPTPLEPTIVHNDFKLDNVMFDSSARVSAVLDWEMATIGDPLVDVGLTLCYWRLGSVSSQSADLGLYSREQFLERYANKTGRNLEHIHWYEILGIFKLAVILQQIYFRYRQGQTQDERFKHFDLRVASLVNDAMQLMERHR